MTGSPARPRIRHNDYSPLVPPPVGEWVPALSASVVIPAHGHQGRLDLTLAALAAQTYPASLTEVIVVDDGSDPPLRLPEIRPDNTRIIFSPPGGWGAGYAMNAGIEAAEGEIVQRLDADMVISREHLEALFRWHHLTDYLVTIGGKKFAEEPELTAEQVYDAVRQGEPETLFDSAALVSSSTEETIRRLDGLRASRNPYQVCTGPTVSLRRTLLREVRGFDPEVVRGQDTEFAYRLAQAGAVFVPDLTARAVHLGLPAQRGEHGKAIVRLVETHLAHKVPLRRDLRKERARRRLVPYVEIVLDVTGTDEALIRSAVDTILNSTDLGGTDRAGTLTDIALTLLGPWPDLSERVGRMPGTPQFDLALVRDAFRHDQRIRFTEQAAPTAAPAPFRYTAPIDAPPTADALERMTKAMLEERLGLLVVELPDGRTATLERTEAVARARLLAQPGEKLAAVIEETHGVRHASAKDFRTASPESMDAAPRTPAQQGTAKQSTAPKPGGSKSAESAESAESTPAEPRSAETGSAETGSAETGRTGETRQRRGRRLFRRG